MNTPNPPTPTQPAMPTLGSIVGSALGGLLVAKTGLGGDAVTGGLIVSGITGVFTSLFHWLGTKIGANW